MKTRTIVIGDVHGCLDELDALLLKVDYRQGKDELILAGDLIDRGPYSVGVVRRAQEIGAKVVMGNHEEKHLRWRKHELKKLTNPKYKNPMKPMRPDMASEHNKLTQKDMDFLSSLPIFIKLDEEWTVIHGGLRPDIPIVEQDPKEVIRLRYLDDGGEMLALEDDYSPPANSIYWTEKWTGPEKIIYGHCVHSLEKPRITPLTFGLDTGCCFGGHLTAMILPTQEIVQVKATQNYCGWMPKVTGL